MKFFKKYINVLTSICLIFVLMCPMYMPVKGNDSSPFSDVSPEDWHYSYIKLLSQQNIIKGMTPTTFEPSSQLTAAQLCALVVRYLGLEENAVQSNINSQNDLWFYGYVEQLYKCGILEESDFGFVEKSDSLFIDQQSVKLFNSPIRRDKTAKILAKSFDYQNSFIVGGAYDQESLSVHAQTISDYDSIPSDMREYVVKCYYNGVFNGYDDRRFIPSGYLTRAEGAKIVAVIMNYNMRELHEYRQLPDTAKVTDQSYLKDWSDKRILDSQKLEEIVAQVAKGLEFTTSHIKLTQQNIIPAGYMMEAHFFAKDESVYKPVYSTKSSNAMLPFTHNFPCQGERSVIITLLSSESNGRVDATAEFRCDQDGKIYFTDIQTRKIS